MNKTCKIPTGWERKVQEHRHSNIVEFLGELEHYSKGEVKQLKQESNSIFFFTNLRFLSSEEV